MKKGAVSLTLKGHNGSILSVAVTPPTHGPEQEGTALDVGMVATLAGRAVFALAR